MSVGRTYFAAFSNEGTAGYATAGNGVNRKTIDKFAFPSDTRTILTAQLANDRGGVAGAGGKDVCGYVAGSDSQATTVEKLLFSAETVSTLGTGLSPGRGLAAGMSNSGTL